MYEKVGHCTECDKTVYCEDGFLDGVHHEGELFCWKCDQKRNLQKLENDEELRQ
ncbi:hypothetical protein [Gracilibacillus salitolerans]|uniref:hypothetical protein n=1 Tax=Gracilibacillus salitolerans TaxID=2663022 RepID=UPI001891E7D1|nr:hypothetical protein [Gracilibacillus salitolerans]